MFCSIAAFVAWRVLGDVGLVVVSPVFGVAFARPIIDACSGLRHIGRNIIYEADEGKYFAYRGQQLRVWEDETQTRWIRLADIRSVLPDLPRDEVLVRILGPDITQLDGKRDLYVAAGRLIKLLENSSQVEAIKFKSWIAKEVYFPSGAARRERLARINSGEGGSAA